MRDSVNFPTDITLEILVKVNQLTPQLPEILTWLTQNKGYPIRTRIRAAYTLGKLGQKKDVLQILYSFLNAEGTDKIDALKYIGLLLESDTFPKILSSGKIWNTINP
jgi:hypothetical protein